MSATAMASEIGDRLKQESDKLRKLELVGHAAEMVHKSNKKKKRKGRSKLGTLTMLVVVGGFVYGLYKLMRSESTTGSDFGGNGVREADNGATTARPTVKSA